MKKYLEKIKKQGNLSTQIVMVVGIILIINFLSYQIFYRFDLTENKVYSISQTTKDTLRNLDDLVSIKAYFSESLPPQYLSVRQDVADTLAEFQNYSNNRVAVEFIDPKENDELQQELRVQGIPQLQFNVLQNDKYELTNGYLGISIHFGDKVEVIPVLDNARNLEYQLTSSIKKLIADKTPVLGVASGNGEVDMTEMNQAIEKFREIYEVQTVDLAAGDDIPENIDALMIAGAKDDFNERERFVIDQFLMRGKSAVFLIDGVTIADNLVATANDLSINELISQYGISISPYFALDKLNDLASFSQGFISISVPYPFFVRVIQDGLNQENAIASKIQSLILPWTSPLTINYQLSSDIKVLAQTSQNAWLMRDNFDLNPQGNFAYQPDQESYALAAARFGPLTSAFSGYIAKDTETGEYLSSTEQARIVVVGNSKFATDTFLQRYPDNLVFLQNVVDAVALDEDLINIRAKNITDRPLEGVEDASKKTIKYFNIFGITIIVLAFGVMRYSLRKKSRFADEF